MVGVSTKGDNVWESPQHSTTSRVSFSEHELKILCLKTGKG